MGSRFININDKILLEYSDNAYFKDYKYDILTNNNTTYKSFYVAYDNAVESTNTRDNGAERLYDKQSNTWQYLDVDRFESGLNLAITKAKEPVIDLKYNNIKIHLVSGYNFGDMLGFILNVYMLDITGAKANLLNFTFREDFPNNTVQFNTEPLYVNSRYYNRYIELDLLSPESLQDNNYAFILNELLSYALDKSSLVYFDFNEIANIDVNKLSIRSTISRSITPHDAYADFALRIDEVDDYFEFYATYKNTFPTKFINNQSSVGNEWIIEHKLEVYEQLGFTANKTDEIIRVQRTNFDNSLKFRPIIDNADIAFSFSINYICYFKNTTSGELFYRSAKLSKLNPRKYGKSLAKLDIDNFTQLNVYHPQPKNIQHTISLQEQLMPEKTIVNIYLDKVNTLDTTPVEITPFSNTYMFEFENSVANNLQYFLSFISDDGEKIYIVDIEDDNTDTKLYFKITETQAKQIRTFSNNSIFIIGINTNGESTVLYQNTWTKIHTNTNTVTTGVADTTDTNTTTNTSTTNNTNRFLGDTPDFI